MTTRQKSDGGSAPLERARGLAAQGSVAAAFVEVKKVVGATGHAAATLLEAAQMFAALGHTAEATQAYLDAGAAYMDRDGDFESARDAFLAAHAIDNQNLDVVFRLAQVDVHEGRVQDGMAKYIDVLRKSNLKHVPALFDTGCIYQAQGQHDQAILAFKKILDRDRKHVQALVHMGQLHQTKGMLPEAVGFYIQAAELSREQQQIDVARGLLTQVLQIEPGYSRARFLLDDIRETFGDQSAPVAEPRPELSTTAEREASGLSAQTAEEENRAGALLAAAEEPVATEAPSLGEFAQLAADAELAAAREEIEDVRRTLEAERARWQAERDQLTTLHDEAKSALAATEERMRALQEAARERTLAEAAQVAEAEVRLHELQRLANDEEARLEGVRADWAAATSTLNEIESHAKRAQADAEREQQSVVDVQARVDAARRQAEELEAELAVRGNALEKAAADLAAINAEIETAGARRDEAVAKARVETDPGALRAIVPPEACGDSLRSIEALAADGSLPVEVAAETQTLLGEGRAAEAVRVLRAAAYAAARPGAHFLALGDVLRDIGDASGARAAYGWAQTAAPSLADAVQARLGELFLTFADQGTAAALQRDDAHFLATQDPGKAIAAYADLVARFPDDPAFRAELAAAHDRAGNAGAALLAYIAAVRAHLSVRDLGRAAELADRLAALAGANGDALELAADAYEGARRSEGVRHSLERALEAHAASDDADAQERVLTRLIAADDGFAYRPKLASLLAARDDVRGAVETLLDAVEPLVRRARIDEAARAVEAAASMAGKDKDLSARVKAAREVVAGSQAAHDDVALGKMLLAKEQFERAAEAFARALEHDANDADAAYQLGVLYLERLADPAKAEALLERAAAMRPEHVATYPALAVAKALRGDVERAVSMLAELVRYDESQAPYLDYLVERLEQDAASGTPAARFRLGVAYRELGRIEEALVVLQSIQREPEFEVLCHNAIGLCLRRQGLDGAAAKRFTKAIETPGYPEAQYHEALYNLGDLYESRAAENPESLALALSAFEELYASDLTFRDVAERLRHVRSGLGAADNPKVKRLPQRSTDAG